MSQAIMSHDSFSESVFEVLQHDEALDKSSLSYFFEKISFLGNMDQIWFKVAQPTALEIFRNILA